MGEPRKREFTIKYIGTEALGYVFVGLVALIQFYDKLTNLIKYGKTKR